MLFKQVGVSRDELKSYGVSLTIPPDLHLGNILFRLPSTIDDLTTDQLYEKYNPPETWSEEAKRLDGLPLDPWVPTHGIAGIYMGCESEEISLAESRIIVNDYSESFQPAFNSEVTSHTPLVLRPPEMFQGTGALASFPADIWSLACTVFGVMGQHLLFDTLCPSTDRILEEHVDALGRLPEEWWASWENRDKIFDDQAQSVKGNPRWSLEDRLERYIQEPRREYGMAEMDDEEKQAFLELMRSMLKFRPEDRASAQQVLESKWMRVWARPAFESLEDMSSSSGSSALPTPPTSPTFPYLPDMHQNVESEASLLALNATEIVLRQEDCSKLDVIQTMLPMDSTECYSCNVNPT